MCALFLRILRLGDAMFTVICRTVLLYSLLLAAMRIVGKRQIGELQLSELITTLMLSELAVLPLGSPDFPLWRAIVPILSLLLLEYILSSLTCRSLSLRRLLFGTPSILIYKGRLNVKELRRLRMDLIELISELRLKDVSDISDVRMAILEDNGQLSVFKNTEAAAATPFSLRDSGEYGVSLPVLIDGQLVSNAMVHAGVDEKWIDSRLARRGWERKDILLMSVDEKKRTVYILKNSPDGTITEVNEA